MPGTGTLGKLFFQKFSTDFGRQKLLLPRSKTDEMNKLEKGRLWPRRVSLVSHMPSRQENNPAETVATARRIRRAA
jgi:hypothetical protein